MKKLSFLIAFAILLCAMASSQVKVKAHPPKDANDPTKATASASFDILVSRLIRLKDVHMISPFGLRQKFPKDASIRIEEVVTNKDGTITFRPVASQFLVTSGRTKIETGKISGRFEAANLRFTGSTNPGLYAGENGKTWRVTVTVPKKKMASGLYKSRRFSAIWWWLLTNDAATSVTPPSVVGPTTPSNPPLSQPVAEATVDPVNRRGEIVTSVAAGSVLSLRVDLPNPSVYGIFVGVADNPTWTILGVEMEAGPQQVALPVFFSQAVVGGVGTTDNSGYANASLQIPTYMKGFTLYMQALYMDEEVVKTEVTSVTID